MTQRDWQKDMDVVQALKGNKVADAMCYWLQEAKERGEREQRLKEAAEKVREIYESEYTDEEAVNAINDMFKDLLFTLYPDTPATTPIKEDDK